MERLFDTAQDAHRRTSVPLDEEPLAARMRPTSLEEFVGQEHLLEPGSALREAIEHGRPQSMIFFGPPGSGKTTLARIVAAATQAAFEETSAVNAGRQEVRDVIERAEHRRATSQAPTIFFLDEIHRFNKAQQDALLPAVEEGLLTLIGATTENPYFEVNSALLSRCQLYELRSLSEEDVLTVLRRALGAEHGVPQPAPEVAGDALDFLAMRCDGDARVALNALELATHTAAELGSAVTIELAEGALQKKVLLYDKQADRHYDYISAFIKSMRGSDPDAAVYYLAVMIEGGEDPRFIARRMIVFASEDVGNADPQALQVAVAAAQAVEHVGLPECRINLSQAATYLALAPKSNAAIVAIDRARHDVAAEGAATPPAPIRSSAYPAAKKLGRGVGYDYPHSNPGAITEQELMPEGLEDRRYYLPGDRGTEAELARRLKEIRRRRGKAGDDPAHSPRAG